MNGHNQPSRPEVEGFQIYDLKQIQWTVAIREWLGLGRKKVAVTVGVARYKADIRSRGLSITDLKTSLFLVSELIWIKSDNESALDGSHFDVCRVSFSWLLFQFPETGGSFLKKEIRLVFSLLFPLARACTSSYKKKLKPTVAEVPLAGRREEIF